MDVYAFMEIYVYGKVAAVGEYISLKIQNGWQLRRIVVFIFIVININKNSKNILYIQYKFYFSHYVVKDMNLCKQI